MARVIHRPSGATCSFKLQNASKALPLVLQGIKKPAVTRTSGRVMGETYIWHTHFKLASPAYGVPKAAFEPQDTTGFMFQVAQMSPMQLVLSHPVG